MYTLRRISKNDVEINFNLGNSYIVVKRESERSGSEFNKALASYYKKKVGDTFNEKDKEEAMRIHSFVYNDGSSELYPLWNEDKYYIMTENGNTFSNLTLRN